MSSLFKYEKQFKLESGKKLRNLEIGYQTFGKLNAEKDNVVWVCHALTANSDVFDWWKGLFGNSALFNPEAHFIVCANVLGSCYGTTNPLSINPVTKQPYYLGFPAITVRDMVAAHELLAQHLTIDRIKLLIGGSLGGQQALEWAIKKPSFIENMVVIAANATHSPWGIAFNESQRLAIAADRTFYAQQPTGGLKGLKAARSIALLSYRSYDAYAGSQLESVHDKTDNFRAASYQNYQGEKLCKRFNAYSYWYLSKAMDSHNVGRGRKTVANALSAITANTLVIGIDNDVLFPIGEQKHLAAHIQGAVFKNISSDYGHDDFLIETDQLVSIISEYLKETIHKKIIKLQIPA